ncbi:MAG: hypothetical protein ACI3WQ_08755 [Faecousia sp.]
MDGLRQYVIAAVAAGLLCGVINRLTQISGCREVVQVLCGVFMTIVLLQPIYGLGDTSWEFLFSGFERQAEEVAADGVLAADSMKEEIIKQQTEAYILDKATAMGAEVDVSVTVGEDCIPVSARISGTVSPLIRSRLTDILESELGIPGEHQQWTG